MPVKDHINAFRSTKTSFKPNKTLIEDVANMIILERKAYFAEGRSKLHKELIKFEKKPSDFERYESSKNKRSSCDQSRWS
jgi:hypothetical protein